MPAKDYTAPLLQVIDSLLDELNRGKPHRGVSLDSSLERDLGLDSLSRVELLARLERHFGLALPEQTFTEAETPRDLLRELNRASAHTHISPATIQAAPRQQTTTYPDEAQTLLEVLEWHVAQHPRRLHIQLYTDAGDGATLSYGELHQGAQRLAAGLQGLGLQAGEPVAIMLPTGSEYFYAFFGILLAGGIPVPIYPPTRPNQLEDHLRRHTRILGNCRATSLITVPAAQQVARLLKSQLETLQHILTVDELLASGGDYQRPAIAPQDTAFLQYTSGSTGNPKGVVLSHANLLANIRAMGERVQANSSDVFVSWLPLYHDMGLIGAWLGSLYFAALFVVMSPLAFLSRPQRWLQAIHRYRGTLSAAPNFGYELCLHRLEDQDLESLDLSCWRAAFNGAEAVSPETVQQFSQRFAAYGLPATAMMPVYGLAESSVGLAFPLLGQTVRIDSIQREAFMQRGKAIPAPGDDTKALRFVACGQPLAGHEIRIADANGEELPERQEGHLQFRGPSATSGYLRNPEATRKLFAGDWLDTGDLAYLSEGELFVTGRIKDVIIRAGRNLYPHELEQAVGDIPEIRRGRVAVFGATEPASGTERLVVLAETRQHEPEALARLRSRINSIASELIGGPADDIVLARPNTVLKTSSGKVRRAACRELYEQGLLDKQHSALWRQLSRIMLGSLVPLTRRLRNSLRSQLWVIFAKAVFYTLAPISWLLVVSLPIPGWRWGIMRGATRLLSLLSGCPLRVEGSQHLPPPGQACVYVVNHASYLDGPLLIAALKRPFSFVAKAELARQGIAGSFLRAIDAEFVERFDAQQSISDAQRISQRAGKGRSLLFFPEGTFSRTPGLQRFRMGAFLTAAEAGLPVIPVAIRGSRSILRGDSKRPHQGSVTITIGAPISGGEEAADNWQQALALRDAARAHILRHCGEPDLEGQTGRRSE